MADRVQATLTAILLIGAGLFVQSLHRARTAPLGFESERVLVAVIAFAGLGDATPEEYLAGRARRNEARRQALARLQERPDVEKAAVAVGSPFGNAFGVDLSVPGIDSLPALGWRRALYQRGQRRLLRRRGNEVDSRPGIPTATEGKGTARVVHRQRDDGDAPCGRAGCADEMHAHRCRHMPCARSWDRGRRAPLQPASEEPAMQYYIPIGQEEDLGFGGSVLMIRPRAPPRAFAPVAGASIYETGAIVDRATAWPIREKIDPLLRPWKLGATVFTLGGCWLCWSRCSASTA